MSGTVGRRIAGLASVVIDGDVWDVVGEPSWKAVTVTRETIEALSDIPGFKEKPAAGWISLKLLDRGDGSVGAFNGKTDSTVVLTIANGKVISGAHLWCTELSEVNSEEATFTAKFEGRSITEQLMA